MIIHPDMAGPPTRQSPAGCELLEQGYTILRGAVPASLIGGVAHDLEPRFAVTPFCEGGFYGERTKRFGRLLIRSPLMSELVMHQPILDLAELALGNWCERIQLNLTQAIELHAGALAQFPHRDQDMWQGSLGDVEYLVNVMWPLTDFTGIDAAQPLLDASADLVGPVGLFTNFVQIMILLIAWVIVVLAFFILAVQVFVTIIEFKLVTLAGFVLLPFAFFGRTAFMAERVLGHIISSGIKVLVLAVITGIGVTLFDRFMQAGLGPEPDIEQVMAIALGALTLLGLGIFGPSIANGIVTGGPQLGAGAAAGTAVAAGATLAAGAAGATLATGAAATAARGTAAAGARGAGSASAAYAAGAAGKSGAKALGAGLANVARTAASGAGAPVRNLAERARANFAAGRDGPAGNASPARGADAPPAWAAAMRRRQTMTQGATIGAQTLKGGDSHGAGSAPDISEKD